MEYEKCLVELDEVLRHLQKEDLQKIPQEIRQNITNQKDKMYKWNYDETKNLKEQNLNRKTIAMLSYLNMEYLLNEEQRLFMENLHKLNEEKLEKKKREKYNPDNIFQENIEAKNEELLQSNTSENVQMVKTSEEKWYKKFIKAIVNIFRKNK